jgi:hypothetical protein
MMIDGMPVKDKDESGMIFRYCTLAQFFCRISQERWAAVQRGIPLCRGRKVLLRNLAKSVQARKKR